MPFSAISINFKYFLGPFLQFIAISSHIQFFFFFFSFLFLIFFKAIYSPFKTFPAISGHFQPFPAMYMQFQPFGAIFQSICHSVLSRQFTFVQAIYTHLQPLCAHFKTCLTISGHSQLIPAISYHFLSFSTNWIYFQTFPTILWPFIVISSLFFALQPWSAMSSHLLAISNHFKPFPAISSNLERFSSYFYVDRKIS